MASGLGLCWCLLFSFAIISSARNTITLSGDEMVVMRMKGRSLNVKLDDYNEASANRGHDPQMRASGGGGRKRRDTNTP